MYYAIFISVPVFIVGIYTALPFPPVFPCNYHAITVKFPNPLSM